MANSTGTELNFPMKKDRQPKVIIFSEPGKNGNVDGNKVGNTLKRKRKNPNNVENIDDGLDFTEVAREIKEFGVTGFSKRIQRKDKQKYAEHLGAHKQKQQKVPYPMLMERRKKKKEKEEKERDLEKAMGIFKKKKKEDNVNTSQRLNLGRWVDKSKLFGINKKDTNVNVSKHEIEKLKRSKK